MKPVVDDIATEGSPLVPAESGTFQADPRRWVVLTLFCALCFLSTIEWLGFGPIVHEVKPFFHMTAFQVNLLSMAAGIVYVPLIFFVCVMYDRLGLRNSMIVSALCNGIGAMLKLLFVYVAPRFGPLMFAQLLCAFSTVIFQSLPPLLASSWFPSDERVMATAVATMANNLGVAIAFFVPPQIIDPQHATRSRFAWWLGSLGVASMLLPLLMLKGVPTRPRSAPSASANQNDQSGNPRTVARNVWLLLRNKSFMTLAVALALNTSVLWALAPLLAQLVAPFGMSEKAAGTLGFVVVLVGICGAVAIGVYVDKHKNYKSTLATVSALDSLFFGLFIAACSNGADVHWAAYVFTLPAVVVQSGIIPISFDYAVELSFPVPESTSGGFLMAMCSLFNIILMLFASLLLGNNATQESVSRTMAMCVSVLAAAGFGFLAVTENFRRITHEQSYSQNFSPTAVGDKKISDE